jgi:hypothetical protein
MHPISPPINALLVDALHAAVAELYSMPACKLPNGKSCGHKSFVRNSGILLSRFLHAAVALFPALDREKQPVGVH